MNLGLALWFPEDMVDSIEPISKMLKMIEERTYDCSPELVKEVKDIVQIGNCETRGARS